MNDRDYTESDRLDDLATLNDPELIAARENRRFAEENAAKLKLSVEDFALFSRRGFTPDRIPPEDTPARRDMISYMKREEIPPSKWLLISGLYPDCNYSEVDRRKRLRALYKALLLLIRRALARQTTDTNNSERSIYWDPIAEVCRDLEIAQSKLSSFCKEFSGHSLSQVVDCVRAERVQKLMKAHVRQFVRNYKTQCASLAAKSKAEATQEVDLWSVWKALKASRKWPEFCQNSWAVGFGFSTYRRMYRACMAVWKQTPHQMEMALIVELLKDENAAEGATVEFTLDEVEAEVRGIRTYSDTSG